MYRNVARKPGDSAQALASIGSKMAQQYHKVADEQPERDSIIAGETSATYSDLGSTAIAIECASPLQTNPCLQPLTRLFCCGALEDVAGYISL